jgi:hypothetical protein
MKKNMFVILFLILMSPGFLIADVTYTEEEKDDARIVLALGIGLVIYAAILNGSDDQALSRKGISSDLTLYENSLYKATLFPKPVNKINFYSQGLLKNQNESFHIDIIRFEYKIDG